jgi:flavin reductase (DIM6/NTAB) family NADH-FMN oxidoreductase RutF
MVGLITPRPIAWVSTISATGVANLAPFSFFNGVGANPPLIMFCPANGRSGKPKDTLANIQATGDFVVNLVTEEVAEAMNLTAAEYAADIDEFQLAQIDKEASTHVTPPRVAGSAAAMECRLHTSMQLGSGPGGANLVIGRIICIHVRDDLLDSDGKLIEDRLLTIGRLGGSSYVHTTDRFQLPRPPRPQ